MKNIGNTSYKKSYDGDYTKTYKNNRALRQQRSIVRQEYEKASKKTGTTSYNRNSGKRISSENAGRVDAAGPRKGRVSASGPGRTKTFADRQRTIEADRKEEERLQTVSEKARPQATKKREQVLSSKSIDRQDRKQDTGEKKYQYTPPKFDSKTELTDKTTRNRRSKNDLSYIDKNALVPPIKILNDSTYQDIYTDEELNVDEARKRLIYADYIQEESVSKAVIIFSIIFGLFFPLIGPLVVYSIGNKLRTRQYVTYVKSERQKFSLPPTANDKEEGIRIGTFFIVGAAVAGLLQIYSFTYR